MKKIYKILTFLLCSSIILGCFPKDVSAASYDSIGPSYSNVQSSGSTFNTDIFDISKYETLVASCYLNSTNQNSTHTWWPCSVTCQLVKAGASSGTYILNVSASSNGSGNQQGTLDVKSLTGNYYLKWYYSCWQAQNGDYCSAVSIYPTKAYVIPTVAPTMSLSPTSGGTVYYSKDTALSLTCPVPSTTGTPTPTVTYSWSGTGVSNATSRTCSVAATSDPNAYKGKIYTCTVKATNSAGSKTATYTVTLQPDIASFKPSFNSSLS